MPTDREEERLLETALSVADDASVDWEQARRDLPQEAGALAGLEELAEIARAHGESEAPELLETVGEREAGDRGAAGARWGPLEMRRLLGEGSFGEVWLAWDPRLHREVALKLRHAGASLRSTRWLQEARRLARVRHPNVITVHGADLHDGRAGLWMDRVSGRTLEELMEREGAFGAREAALVGIELCGALAAVHGAGLVHGDIKTRNIMREGAPREPRDAGRIVLMDFGSARESTLDEQNDSRGTPLFTAPEVLAGGSPTPASDLYSLGVVLYRLVSGAWPVPAKTLPELRVKLAGDGVTPLRAQRPDLPASFVAVVDRLLAPEPARRFASAAELERALAPVLGMDEHGASRLEMASRRRRFAPLKVAIPALAALAAGAWLSAPMWPRWWWSAHARPAYLAEESVLAAQGVMSDSQFGNTVEDVGDLDGDGRRDLLIGAPGDNGVGRAYLYSLAPTGQWRPTLSFSGETANDYFGCMATSPGDLDGDGSPDLAIAANYNDHDARDAGRVYVYRGGAALDSVPDFILEGKGEMQNFGWYLASAGDLNSDGWPDLVVGAPLDAQAGFRTGRVYVYFGGPKFDAKPDLELTSRVADAQFGNCVRGIGDFNGDGHDDLAVGAPEDDSDGLSAGRVFIYYGGPNVDARADLVLRSNEAGSEFGQIGHVGDLNGDGYVDLPVGAERAKGLTARSGAVFVYFGGPAADAVPDLHLLGERRGDVFGCLTGTDASRDLDGDGAADLVVAARWHDTVPDQNEGRVYVYLGGKQLDEFPDLILDGKNAGGSFGWEATPIPSVRGDGPAALAVGSKFDSRASLMAGAVEVFDLSRYAVVAPAAGTTWKSGAGAQLAWRGASKADVSWSLDQGRTWQTVARDAGGRALNTLRVSVPAGAHGSLRLRLEPSDRTVKGKAEVKIPLRS